MSAGDQANAREYVARMRERGRTDEEIRRRMLQQGWREDRLADLLGPGLPCGEGPVTPAEQSVDAKVAARRTLRDSWRVITGSAGSLLVVGSLAGVTLSFGLFIGHWLAAVLATLILSVVFTALCRMALQVLEGGEGGIPSWEQVRSLLPAAIGVVTISGTALSLAAIVLWLLTRGSSASGSGFFDGLWLLTGLLYLIFALPWVLAVVYGLILPSLFMVFPAVADGMGAMEALTFSVRRGMKNVATLLWLETAGTIGFIVLLIVTASLAAVLAAMGEACLVVLIALEAAIFLPWLAALASSAYLQIGAGGSGGEGDSRER